MSPANPAGRRGGELGASHVRVVQFLGLPALDEGEAGGIFNALVQRVEDAPLFGLGRDDEGGERSARRVLHAWPCLQQSNGYDFGHLSFLMLRRLGASGVVFVSANGPEGG